MPKLEFPKRLSQIGPSGTLGLLEKAAKMKKEGKDVISLGAGEPDFDTPSKITEAAKAALDEGKTHYVTSRGIPELREAIVGKFKDENGIDVGLDEIIVTVGAKDALFNIMLALIDEGDEVILPDPYWVSYSAMILFAGGKVVSVPVGDAEEFEPKPEAVAEKVTDRTKMIVLNSPNNPTGAVYSDDTLKGISDICVDKDILAVSDEVYEKMVYDGITHKSLATFDGMSDRTITVNALSKTYAMTGWRLGYVAASKEIIDKLNVIQQHSVSHPTSFVQYAAVNAFTGLEAEQKAMVEEFDKRRKMVVSSLKEIEGFECVMPKGAFYAFPNISGTGMSSSELADHLVDKVYVVVPPGSAFGPNGEGHLRISYAASQETLSSALDRIKKAVESN